MKGYPNTKQRTLLLNIIQNTEGHLDAKELYRLAAARDSSISTATVYRSLNLFKEMGLIQEHRLGQTCCSYEKTQSIQHQHLVCSKCGKVIDFDCPLSDIVDKVNKQQGFVVTKAQVYFEGYCAECALEKEK